MGGGPWDPPKVFCIFYYYCIKFYDQYFFCNSHPYGYASLDEKKKSNQPRRFLTN